MDGADEIDGVDARGDADLFEARRQVANRFVAIVVQRVEGLQVVVAVVAVVVVVVDAVTITTVFVVVQRVVVGLFRVLVNLFGPKKGAPISGRHLGPPQTKAKVSAQVQFNKKLLTLTLLFVIVYFFLELNKQTRWY